MPTNVIVAGESGIGKSSLINLITGQQLAATSNDSTTCTLSPHSYKTCIRGYDFTLWDTPGFNDGLDCRSDSTTSCSALVRSLIQRLQHQNGADIDLVLYCFPAARAKSNLLKNYRAICSLLPPSTPIAAVVTRLERYEGGMEGWWLKNEAELTKFEMTFVDHACVTALQDSASLTPSIRQRIEDSKGALKSLLIRACHPHCITPLTPIFPSLPLQESKKRESEVNPSCGIMPAYS
ncbi:hypothetical protein ID866_2704 [Astraeus odoratus]|nr:hypothetical protein ID866_2704 [Astraeus odoratus]